MQDKTEFSMALDQKLDELIAWSIKNTSAKDADLRFSDFTRLRKEFHKLATGNLHATEPEPEPEEGGAQYINDNPAPWP
jgi:hypothetical protein